ncbi:DUF6992 family protein [Hymenobacter psychrophilus]|uniref:Uncharacterized protein n=1 Tax=Hymenobacter psychrophilus TaxID=651662 RepID=A0A1H3JUL7_9BACT|nr:hypothetical protein [Hymenobacter psychrophilus]SDY43647.1 hypothetical protein SAMN04488069_108222 [Hymenobacter psychrophilus]
MPIFATDLPAINQARELMAEHGMGLLGVWALLNLVISGYHVSRTDARTAAHHFHFMNVAWNMVNTLLAVWGILRAQPQGVAGLSLADSLAAQQSFEHLLLINAALDVGYVLIGLWLHRRAPAAERPERLHGYARSLWLQGGFLLCFDLTFYFAYHQFAAQLVQ